MTPWPPAARHNLPVMPLPALLVQLSRLHDLIRRRATGDVALCARRLGVSVSTLYRYLSLLRTLGGPIAYSPHDQTYYYTEPVDFVIGYRPCGEGAGTSSGEESRGGELIFFQKKLSLSPHERQALSV